jgi:hypothetical protein
MSPRAVNGIDRKSSTSLRKMRTSFGPVEAGDKFEVEVGKTLKTARFERADRTAACVGGTYCTQIPAVLHCK